QGDTVLFNQGAVATIKACLLLGLLSTIGLSFAGPAVLIILYGHDFSAGAQIICWLALMQGIRTAKAGPTIIAISCGQTKLPLIANVVRSLGVGFVLISIWLGWGIFGVVVGGIIGEILAVIVFLELCRRRIGLNLGLVYKSFLVSIVMVTGSIVLTTNYIDGSAPLIEIGSSLIVGLFAIVVFLIVAPDLIKWFRSTEKKQTDISA
ncbi:MAG: hypothetical protein V7727_04905, partial [Sneathiella sp.]